MSRVQRVVLIHNSDPNSIINIDHKLTYKNNKMNKLTYNKRQTESSAIATQSVSAQHCDLLSKNIIV